MAYNLSLSSITNIPVHPTVTWKKGSSKGEQAMLIGNGITPYGQGCMWKEALAVLYWVVR